jgi:hypothetical protein
MLASELGRGVPGCNLDNLDLTDLLFLYSQDFFGHRVRDGIYNAINA